VTTTFIRADQLKVGDVFLKPGSDICWECHFRKLNRPWKGKITITASVFGLDPKNTVEIVFDTGDIVKVAP